MAPARSDRASPKKKKKKAPALSDIGIAEEGDEDAEEAAQAAALLAEVLRPARTGPPPDAAYLRPAEPTARDRSGDTPRPPKRVAILTCGKSGEDLGFSTAVAALVHEYTSRHPSIEVLCFTNGFEGLLLNQSVAQQQATAPVESTGSPIGTSDVSLADPAACVLRGLCQEGQDPLKLAAAQLQHDGIDALHCVGDARANCTAAALAASLAAENYALTVCGLPKALENDTTPLTQTLGAWTAAEQTARFFLEQAGGSGGEGAPKRLFVHELLGSSGWLTAAAAAKYRDLLTERFESAVEAALVAVGADETPDETVDGNDIDGAAAGAAASAAAAAAAAAREQAAVHGVYLPEMAPFDLAAEAARLSSLLQAVGRVNVFVAAGATASVSALWPMVGADEVVVVRSADFARHSAANQADRQLITATAQLAVHRAVNRQSGVIGLDEASEEPWRLRLVGFERLKGGKAFECKKMPWFVDLLEKIGQASTDTE